ncbi:hypothetical protein LCGC14_2424080, partial [marine sediment metagenome]
MTCFVHVYRWEDTDGIGPYNGLHRYSTELISIHGCNDFVTHPTIRYEFGDLSHERTQSVRNLSAFASLNQANAWFTDKEKTNLVAYGWRF